MPDYSPGTGRGRLVLSATILASAAVFLLGSGVSIALPSIQSSFHEDLSALQWVVNAQLVTLAALLPIGGSLGDRFGRKRVFLTGMVAFALAAIISGLARNVAQLIVFQALQGAGSALMVPQSLAIINVSFAESERGQVIGFWAGMSGGVSALGPWASGWLIEHFSWPAVFYLSAAVALIALVIASFSVSESKNLTTRRLDWTGVLCLLGGLFGIAYGLIYGPSRWTSPAVVGGLCGGVVLLVLFVFVESRQADPVVPLSIFKNPLVSGANLATLLVYSALNGVTLFSVLDMQQVQGYSPSTAGLAVLPTVVCITFLSAPAGSLADRTGPRLQMTLGPFVVAAAAAYLGLASSTSGSYLVRFFPGFTLLGIGMALLIAPLTKSALAVPGELSGAASGVNNAASRVAALLAVAFLGAVMLSVFSTQLSRLLPSSGLSAVEQQQLWSQSAKLGGIGIPGTFSEAAGSLARRLVSESFDNAYRWTMLTCAALAFGGGLVSSLTIHNPARKAPDAR